MEQESTPLYACVINGFPIQITNPNYSSITIESIAHGLSSNFRFNAQTVRPITIAMHSLIVASMVPRKYKLAALLHDAHEAYIGDIIMPVKKLLGHEAVNSIEKPLKQAIRSKFGVGEETDAEIQAIERADRLSALAEIATLCPEYGNAIEYWRLISGIPGCTRDEFDKLCKEISECCQYKWREISDCRERDKALFLYEFRSLTNNWPNG